MVTRFHFRQGTNILILLYHGFPCISTNPIASDFAMIWEIQKVIIMSTFFTAYASDHFSAFTTYVL